MKIKELLFRDIEIKKIPFSLILKVIFAFGLIGMILFYFQPINNIFFRICLVVSFFASLISGLSLSWKHKFIFWSASILTGIVVGFLFVSRTFSPEKLRDSYVKNLVRYKDVNYVWGGENSYGIDCSGLTRKALRDTLIISGFNDINGSLITHAFFDWWFDRTAKSMRDLYRGDTILLFDSPTINNLDHSLILPGDLAITADGIHVLAYLGQNKWIQASPGAEKVKIDEIPSSDSWFKVPVKLVRWKILN